MKWTKKLRWKLCFFPSGDSHSTGSETSSVCMCVCMHTHMHVLRLMTGYWEDQTKNWWHNVSKINMTVKQWLDTGNNGLAEPGVCRESSSLEMEEGRIPTTTSHTSLQATQLHIIKTKGQETINYSVRFQSVSARNTRWMQKSAVTGFTICTATLHLTFIWPCFTSTMM